MLYQPLSFLDDHLGNLNVPFGRFIEGGADHLGLDGSLHIRHFLRSLVDQQHKGHNVLVAGNNRIGDKLQQHGFSGSRW